MSGTLIGDNDYFVASGYDHDGGNAYVIADIEHCYQVWRDRDIIHECQWDEPCPYRPNDYDEYSGGDYYDNFYGDFYGSDYFGDEDFTAEAICRHDRPGNGVGECFDCDMDAYDDFQFEYAAKDDIAHRDPVVYQKNMSRSKRRAQTVRGHRRKLRIFRLFPRYSHMPASHEWHATRRPRPADEKEEIVRMENFRNRKNSYLG